MKTFKLQITEEEMVALIDFHTRKLSSQRPSIEVAQRIVDLTRRLNKDTPEIEGDPRPKNTQIEAAQENAKIPEGW